MHSTWEAWTTLWRGKFFNYVHVKVVPVYCSLTHWIVTLLMNFAKELLEIKGKSCGNEQLRSFVLDIKRKLKARSVHCFTRQKSSSAAKVFCAKARKALQKLPHATHNKSSSSACRWTQSRAHVRIFFLHFHKVRGLFRICISIRPVDLRWFMTPNGMQIQKIYRGNKKIIRVNRDCLCSLLAISNIEWHDINCLGHVSVAYSKQKLRASTCS